jgi:hypothetical protein
LVSPGWQPSTSIFTPSSRFCSLTSEEQPRAAANAAAVWTSLAGGCSWPLGDLGQKAAHHSTLEWTYNTTPHHTRPDYDKEWATHDPVGVFFFLLLVCLPARAACYLSKLRNPPASPGPPSLSGKPPGKMISQKVGRGQDQTRQKKSDSYSRKIPLVNITLHSAKPAPATGHHSGFVESSFHSKHLTGICLPFSCPRPLMPTLATPHVPDKGVPSSIACRPRLVGHVQRACYCWSVQICLLRRPIADPRILLESF